MKTLRIRRFSNDTSYLVADAPDKMAVEQSCKVEHAGFEEAQLKTDAATAEILVFPILGDDRLPAQIHHWLCRCRGVAGPHGVVVSGDFTVGETPASRVSFEATRMLTAGGSHQLCPPQLIDTPLVPGWQRALDDWFTSLVAALGTSSANARRRRASTDGMPTPRRAPMSAPNGHEHALAEITQLLPSPPAVELDADGFCVALDLTDGAPYPRSLLRLLSGAARTHLLAAVGELTRLEQLSLAFAGLDSLQQPLPASLRTLDLTENPVADLDVLSPLADLRQLNIAACGLTQLPPALADLTLLHTLIAAKNRIAQLPDWFDQLHNLRRATFYRNQLTRPVAAIAGLSELRILNVGASPVVDLAADPAGMPGLRALGLCMTKITELPDWVLDHPTLEMVDISKNPDLQLDVRNPNALPVLTTAMPAFDSFEPRVTSLVEAAHV